MLRQLRPAVVLLILLSALTGLVYPLAITGVAQAVMPHRANGSLVGKADAPVGSVLIGQNFASDRYFHGRPSATQAQDPAHPDDSSKTIDAPYNADNSTGSNLGPTSQKLVDRVKADVEAKRAAGWADADSRRRGDDLGLRARSRDFAGDRLRPGSRRRQGARAARGKGAGDGRGACQRPRVRPHRRAARQRAAVEPDARRDVGAPW